MAPRLFSFNATISKEIPTNLGTLYGWWQSLAVSRRQRRRQTGPHPRQYRRKLLPSSRFRHPVKLWVNDFDQNGIMDKVLTSTINGKDMPVFLKHEMEDQIPSLKKQNLKHAAYAKKSIQELFPSDMLDSAAVKLFNYTLPYRH
jgi:hypothetical protein